MEQEPYKGFTLEEDDFASNPDPRVACMLLLDVSASMSGTPIDELNAALRQFRDELLQDTFAARRAEVAIISFGGHVHLDRDFATAPHLDVPVFSPRGDTPMAEALIRGISQIESRKSTYLSRGVPYYRPWMFLITDGEPTDNHSSWQTACDAVGLGERQKKFSFFAIGTSGANFARLREVSPIRPPMELKGLAYREFFRWLSNSLARVSQSQVGSGIALPPATGEDGWASVPT